MVKSILKRFSLDQVMCLALGWEEKGKCIFRGVGQGRMVTLFSRLIFPPHVEHGHLAHWRPAGPVISQTQGFQLSPNPCSPCPSLQSLLKAIRSRLFELVRMLGPKPRRSVILPPLWSCSGKSQGYAAWWQPKAVWQKQRQGDLKKEGANLTKGVGKTTESLFLSGTSRPPSTNVSCCHQEAFVGWQYSDGLILWFWEIKPVHFGVLISNTLVLLILN